eukprot:934343-Prymnesium_polylepis.2
MSRMQRLHPAWRAAWHICAAIEPALPSVRRRQPARCQMRECAPSPPVATSCALPRVRPFFGPPRNGVPLFDPTCERT